jgi:hypothetical protein
VLAAPPDHFFKIQEGTTPPPIPHEDEIEACFQDARKVDPDLVVDTQARLEAKGDGTVISASVPTPDSPSFQQCVEEKAMSWTLPLPPNPPSSSPPPAKARITMLFPIRLPKK